MRRTIRYCVDVRVVECREGSRAEKLISSDTVTAFNDPAEAEGFASRLVITGEQLTKEHDS